MKKEPLICEQAGFCKFRRIGKLACAHQGFHERRDDCKYNPCNHYPVYAAGKFDYVKLRCIKRSTWLRRKINAT